MSHWRGVLLGVVGLLGGHAAQAADCAWADAGLVNAPVVLTDAAGGTLQNPDGKLQSVLVELKFDGSDPRPNVRVEWLAGEPKGGGATPWLEALIGRLKNQRRVCAGGTAPKAHFAQVFTYVDNPMHATLASQAEPVASTAQLALVPAPCLSGYQLKKALTYPDAARRKGIHGTVYTELRVIPGSRWFDIIWMKGPSLLVQELRNYLLHEAPNCEPHAPTTFRQDFVFQLQDGCDSATRVQMGSGVTDAQLVALRKRMDCDAVFAETEIGTPSAKRSDGNSTMPQPDIRKAYLAHIAGYESYLLDSSYLLTLPRSASASTATETESQAMVRQANASMRTELVYRPIGDMKERMYAEATASVARESATHGGGSPHPPAKTEDFR